MSNQPPWPVDEAFQVLRRHLGGVGVALAELECAINVRRVSLLRWDTRVPGWSYDPPQTLSADAARLLRLRLDDGYAIILTRDPSGHTAECILNGETWYLNENFHYVVPHDDLVERWPLFAPNKPRSDEDKHPVDAVVRVLNECAAEGFKLPVYRKARLDEINKRLTQQVSLSTLRRAEKRREGEPH